MDTRTILADLKAELNRLNQAIAALEALDGTGAATPITTTAAKAAPMRARAGRRRMSAAGRRRISEAAKARWAARRKLAAPAGVKSTAAKPASKKTSVRRTMSPAARRKIAEAQRKRWAAQKAAAKKPAKKAAARRALAKKAEQGSSSAGVMGLLKSVFQ